MRGLKSLLLLLVLVAAVAAVAQDEGAAGEQTMPPMGPPEEMKQLAGLVGTWHYKGEVLMDPHGEEWVTQEAEAVQTLVAGGAALQMDFYSEMMGMQIKGINLTCYDRQKGQWQQMWIDNMVGSMSLYTGTFENGRLVTSGVDRWQGEDVYMRMTTYDITADSVKFLTEHSFDGETWYESMRGVYTRK